MGKGTISGGGTDGLYSVDVSLARARITAQISRMTENIAALAAQIAATEVLITAKNAEITASEALLVLYANDPAHHNDLKTTSQALIKQQNELAALLQQKHLYELQKKTLELRIKYFETNTSNDPTVSAWCADLTEDLTGVVGTIEVPGERGTVLIRPGYDGGAVYSAARDGQLSASLAQTPEQCFYNWAMLPGWQKWLPTYKFGTITAIDYNADTCDATLEAATSSAQNLNVNAVVSVSGVPVEYMSCNAAAFNVGDSVVIECTNNIGAAITTTYKVIGFKTNPKPCGYYIRLTCNGYTPSAGGEVIKVSDGVQSEQHTTAAGGLCGPFSVVAQGATAYPELYYGNAVNGKSLFCYHNEVAQGAEDYKLAWEVKEEYNVGDLKINYGSTWTSPTAIVNNYVTLHSWLRYTKALSACTYQNETIGDGTYRVYHVDFTGLSLILRTVTNKYNTPPVNLSGAYCGFDDSNPAPPEYGYYNYVSCEYDAGYEEFWGPEYTTPKVYCDERDPEAALVIALQGLFANFVDLSYADLAGKDLAIIIDSEGNLSFDDITINLEAHVVEYSVTCSSGRGEPFCVAEDLSYAIYKTLKFEKVLTPEGHF
jgi:hypothetical protein